MTTRVADHLADALARRGVDTVFLLSGGGMMHLLDAVACHPELAYVAHHHEQAAAIAADAYARRRGGLGACFATSGPGATNILTGVAGAWQDSSPVVFVTGQSKVSQTIRRSGIPGLRQFGVFEVDIVALAEPITKHAVQLQDPATAQEEIERALDIATSGRPGPVLIDVPLDIQGAPLEVVARAREAEGATTVRPDPATVATVLGRLRAARRPLLLAGHGIRAAGAVERFRELLELLNVPVVATQLAKDALPYDHRLFVGHPGPKGDRAGNFALQTADVIVTVGSSMHVLTTGYDVEDFAPQAHKVQIDIDPAVLARQAPFVQEQLHAGVHELFDVLTKLVVEPWPADTEWHHRCATWKRELAVIDEPHVRFPDRVDYYDFTQALSVACPTDVTLTTDAGSAFYVLGQAFRTKADQRYIVSGSLGSMGFALPAATGAAVAAPGTTVVCVTGDGSLQTNVHELATIAHRRLPVKLFVMNNGGYVSIRATQRSYFGGHEAGVDQRTGVALPDLARLAAAYGVPYATVAAETLAVDVAAVLATEGPVLCEVHTAEEQVVIPTVASERLPDGSMRSKPLHDMAPYLSPERLAAYLDFD
jgi:acetolactate synthase-1/2/3 large subunit